LPSRAGLAHGHVVRRAGDVFGLPVNVAQLLTKVATPGALLAAHLDADAVPPGQASVVTRRVDLHPALGGVVATEIRPC
jgi:class 3 adenylate cyclase